MTTLLLTEIFPPHIGGSGRWFWELYRRLPAGEFVVVAGAHPAQSEFDSQHDLRIHRLDFTVQEPYLARIKDYQRLVTEITSVIRTEDVEMIHCGRFLLEGVLATLIRWKLKIPFACYAHGEEVNLFNREYRPPWYKRVVCNSREMGLLGGAVLHNADYMIANSGNTRSILTDRWGLPAEQIEVLYPGVDTGLFAPAQRDIEGRNRLGWAERTVILTVGRLTRRKGHDMMIAALPVIQQTVPDVLYAIVGDGEEATNLRSLVEEKGVESQVVFLHELGDNELIWCYQQCDLFVLPNRRIEGDIEGFGMVLLEAQACGRPVLAGSSGGTEETMRPNETGLIVPCEEVELLAQEVSALLSDKQRLDKMGNAGREWAVQNFDWEILSQRATEIFARRHESSSSRSQLHDNHPRQSQPRGHGKRSFKTKGHLD